MSMMPPPPRPTTPDAVPRRSAPLVAIRLLSTLTLLLLLVQVGLASGFVTGETSLLGWHAANAFFITVVLFTTFVLGVLHALVSRGRWWPALTSLGLWFVAFVQEVLGHTRVVVVHITLGTLLISLVLLQCVLLWRHRHRPLARRDRARRDGSARPTGDEPVRMSGEALG